MGKNILVAHGGGPTAVINCSLQGVVEAARASGKVDKIYAARFGAEGILAGDLIDLGAVEEERRWGRGAYRENKITPSKI